MQRVRLASEDNIIQPAASLNKKSNVFEGDSEYYINSFLKFESPFTSERYQETMFVKNKFFLQIFIIFSVVIWLTLYYSPSCFTISNFTCGLLCFSLSFLFITFHFLSWIPRLLFLFPEAFFLKDFGIFLLSQSKILYFLFGNALTLTISKLD